MTLPRFPESLPEFQRVFPDEAHCAAYLEGMRWPDGFACQYCGSTAEPYRFSNRLSVLRCRTCQRDTSLTAGTVMERTHTPLSVWFWGAYLIVSQTPGQSALQFQRQLGIGRYETAFQMLHKLRAGLVNPTRDRIGGNGIVEIDETLIGGRTRGEGCGVHHMATVVGAVEVRLSEKKRKKVEHEGGIPVAGRFYAGRLRLRVLKKERNWQEIGGFITENVEPGATVKTDGWGPYGNLVALGYEHDPLVLHGDPKKAGAHLPMIHIVFSNLKTWLLGTHHGVSQHHLQAYLNEYVFRFNRRFYPFNAFNSVLGIASRVAAPTYDELYSGEWVHMNGVRA